MTPSERIAALRAVNPDAALLATACSVAFRIEPGLLRTLRLLLPGADAGAEADLWLSDLISGRDASALVIDPLVAGELRHELRDPAMAWLKDAAAQRVAVAHRDAHWSVRLEERIRLLDCGEAWELAGPADDLLVAALERLRTEPDPKGIARWLLGAVGRLPAEVAAGQVARVSAVAAGLHVDGRAPDPGLLSATETAGWLPWLSTQLPTVDVPLSMRDGAVLVGAEAFGAGAIGTGPGAADTGVQLRGVPDTDPLTLEVLWTDGSRPRSRRVRFRLDEPVQVETGTRSVTLVTLTGASYELTLADDPAARTEAGLRFDAQKARLRPCLARESEIGLLTVEAEVDRPGRAWVGIIGRARRGGSTMLVAATDALRERGFGVVEHFYEQEKASEPDWPRLGGPDDPAIVERSCLAQLEAAYPVEWAGLASRLPGRTQGRPDLAPVLHGLAEAGAFRRRPLLIALDGVPPGPGGRSVLWTMPFPSQPPAGVRYLVACRNWSAVRDYLEDGDTRFALGDDPGADRAVCLAMLARSASDLERACGGPVTGAALDELLRLAEDTPGILAGMVDWILSRPAGSVRLDGIPPVLTGRWAEFRMTLSGRYQSMSDVMLDLLRAAHGRHTDADLAEAVAAAPELSADIWADFMTGAASLLDLPGPGGLVRLAAPEAADQLAAQARYGDRYLGLRGDPPAQLARAASWTRLAAAVHHALAAGDHAEAVALCTDLLVLRRRYAEDLPGLLADLAEVAGAVEQPAAVTAVHAALRGLVKYQVPVDRFAPALLDRLAADGVADTVPDLAGDLALASPLLARRVLGEDDLRGSGAGSAVDVEEPVLGLVDGEPGHADPVRVVTARGVRTAARMGYTYDNGSLRGDVIGAVRGPGGRFAFWSGEALSLGGDAQATVPLPWPVDEVRTVFRLAGTVALSRYCTLTVLSPSSPPRVLVGHGGPITAVVEADGGSLLTASRDGTIWRWQPGSDVPAQTYAGHRGEVTRLVMVSATRFASGGEDGCVLFWDLPGDGHPADRWQAHEAAITALAPDDHGLAAGAADGRVSWRDPSGRTLVLGQHHEPVRGLARVGDRIVSWADEIRFWPAGGGPAVGVRAFPGGVEDVMFGSDTYTALCGDGTVQRHAIPASTPDAEPAYLGCLAVRDARAIVGLGLDVLDVGGQGDVLSLVSTGGKASAPGEEFVQALVASSGWVLRRRDGVIQAQSGIRPNVEASLVAAHPSGAAVVVQDRTVAVLDGFRPPFTAPAEVTSLAVNINGEVVAGLADGRVCRTSLGDSTGRVQALPGAGRAVTAVAVLRDGTIVTGSEDGDVHWHPTAASGSGEAHLRSGGAITGIVVLQPWVVTASRDGTLVLWDVETRRPVHRIEIGAPVVALAGEPAFPEAGADPPPVSELRDHATVAARDVRGRLWLLDLDRLLPPPAPPFDAAPDVSVRTRPTGRSTEELQVVIRPGKSADVVAVRFRIAGLPPIVTAGPGVDLDPSGQLAVPWALDELNPLRFAARIPEGVGPLQDIAAEAEIDLVSRQVRGYRATIRRRAEWSREKGGGGGEEEDREQDSAEVPDPQA